MIWQNNGRTAARTRTVRVGQLDVAAAGAPVWVVVGPVHKEAGSRAGAVLDAMAARGPQFRVGLEPSQDTRRWRFTEKPGASAKATFDTTGCTTAQDILDRVLDHRAAAAISVGQAGEYLCVCFDHGIGDSHVMTETVSALSQTTNRLLDPMVVPTSGDPVRVAITHNLQAGFGQAIGQAVGVANAGWSSFPSKRGQCPAHGGEPGDGRVGRAEKAGAFDGYRAVFVKSEPHFADQLRAWRNATNTRASVTGLLMWSICRALRDAGVTRADDCGVLVDLRRFLPRGVHTLSNFCTVAPVRGGTDTSYEKFSAELGAAAESVGPPMKLAAHLVSARARAAIRGRRSQPWWAGTGSPHGSVAHLTISGISKMPALAKIEWTRPTDMELAVALPPGSPAHLSTALRVATNGSVQVTATFLASLVNEETVRGALQDALKLGNFSATTANVPTADRSGAA